MIGRIGLPLLLLASLGLNFWQAADIRARSVSGTPLAQEPQVGEMMPDLALVPEGGTEIVTVSARNHLPTIIYAYTYTCGWCASNIENAKQLAAATGKRFRVFGISLLAGEPKSFVVNHGIGFPVYHSPDAATTKAYRFSRVPYTLVLDPEGRVQRSWHGAYVGNIEAEVREFFKLDGLPGLIPPAPFANPGLGSGP